MPMGMPMGQERMDPRMWRELAEVTARTAFYLLWKVARNQERSLRAGKGQVLRACEREGRCGELSADKAPFSNHKDFGQKPAENCVQAHIGQENSWKQAARIHK